MSSISCIRDPPLSSLFPPVNGILGTAYRFNLSNLLDRLVGRVTWSELLVAPGWSGKYGVYERQWEGMRQNLCREILVNVKRNSYSLAPNMTVLVNKSGTKITCTNLLEEFFINIHVIILFINYIISFNK